MSTDTPLESLLLAILIRGVRQNGAEPDTGMLRGIAGRLAQQVATHGVPPRVRTEADGDGLRPDATAIEERTAQATGAEAPPLVAELTRQLVKAVSYPELIECRRSFETLTPDGHCRRQELERVRRRVSGSHCVDCPYWRALTPERHRVFLREHWHGDAQPLADAQGVFLPDDFRALRHVLANDISPPA